MKRAASLETESRLINKSRQSKNLTTFNAEVRVIEPRSMVNTIRELGIQGFDPLGISELGNESESSTDDGQPVDYQDNLLGMSHQALGQVKTLPYWSTSYMTRSSTDQSQDINSEKGGICVSNNSTRGTTCVVDNSTRGTIPIVCRDIHGKHASQKRDTHVSHLQGTCWTSYGE